MAVKLVDRLSAQVISAITDLSQIDASPSFSFFACVTAPKGEVNYPYLVQTVDQLRAYLGEPTEEHLSLICAYKIIEKGYPGYLVRVASESLSQARAELLNSANEVVVQAVVKQAGTDGNKYSLEVSGATEGKATILLKNGNLTLDTIEVSYNPDDPDFIVGYDHELIEFELIAEDISELKEQTTQFAGGDDGTSDITAQDYIGIEDPNGLASTGSKIFLQRNLSAQFWPTLGYTDKEYMVSMKEVADRRKDVTCIYDIPKGLTKHRARQWVVSEGPYAETPLLEGFNCEVYWDWLEEVWNTKTFLCPPSMYVVTNGLASYIANGPWYPVAGDSRGKISPVSVVTQIPSVADRDQLVTYHINPIYDTGNRGIQIYGNETLNREYSDLSAAHIARTLVHIRSTVDEYTETKKFELNDSVLWSEWVDYVQNKILEPIKTARGLQWYRATMGEALTTRQELSQRKVRGRVELQFTPDAEIFYIDYVVYASSLTEDELNAM